MIITHVVDKPIVNNVTPMYGFAHVTKHNPPTAAAGNIRP